MRPRPPTSTLFPYTTLFRSLPTGEVELQVDTLEILSRSEPLPFQLDSEGVEELTRLRYSYLDLRREDRKSTRLNSSHSSISYAVFCLKKKKTSTSVQSTRIY